MTMTFVPSEHAAQIHGIFEMSSSEGRVDGVVCGRDAAVLASTLLLGLLALSLSRVEGLVPLSGAAGAEELTCCCCGVALEAVGALCAA